ncbi:hypothetical protein Hanom_Chr12g01119731 [Helianthus anomalus]
MLRPLIAILYEGLFITGLISRNHQRSIHRKIENLFPITHVFRMFGIIIT